DLGEVRRLVEVVVDQRIAPSNVVVVAREPTGGASCAVRRLVELPLASPESERELGDLERVLVEVDAEDVFLQDLDALGRGELPLSVPIPVEGAGGGILARVPGSVPVDQKVERSEQERTRATGGIQNAKPCHVIGRQPREQPAERGLDDVANDAIRRVVDAAGLPSALVTPAEGALVQLSEGRKTEPREIEGAETPDQIREHRVVGRGARCKRRGGAQQPMVE